MKRRMKVRQKLLRASQRDQCDNSGCLLPALHVMTTTWFDGRNGALQQVLLDAERLQLGSHAVKVIRVSANIVVRRLNVDLPRCDVIIVIVVVVLDTLCARLRHTHLVRLVVIETGGWVVVNHNVIVV